MSSAAAILKVRKEIRRALEIPLYNLAHDVTDPFDVHWTGQVFDRSVTPTGTKDRYVAAALIPGGVMITEMGDNPRHVNEGGLKLVVRTNVKAGPDVHDDFVTLVSTAYPYNSTPAFSGVTVHIDKITPGEYGFDGGWLFSPMTIDWTVYRRA